MLFGQRADLMLFLLRSHRPREKPTRENVLRKTVDMFLFLIQLFL